MIQLKYFKNIHAKIINKKDNVITVQDACIYSDQNNNKFCFVDFVNMTNSPLLSVMFHIRQFDQTGQFIREGKFYIPNCFHPAGPFEIDEPFPVERECDAVEIYVQRAIFTSRAFYLDSFRTIESVPPAFAPKQQAVIPEGGNFRHNPIPTQAPAAQPKPQAQAAQPATANENVEAVEVDNPEPIPMPIPQGEASTLAPETVGTYKVKNKYYYWIIALFGSLILFIIFLIIYNAIFDVYLSSGVIKNV